METKKVQALNDDLLENIIGGISLRGVFRHTCRDCQNVWYNEQGTSACPRCISKPGKFHFCFIGATASFQSPAFRIP